MRDPFLSPFNHRSFWNTALHRDYDLVACNIRNADNYGVIDDTDFIVLEPNAPLMDVRRYDTSVASPLGFWAVGYSKPEDHGIWVTDEVLVRLPIPPNLEMRGRINGGQNMAGVALMPDRDSLIHLQPFSKWPQNDFAAARLVRPEIESIYGEGRYGSHGGSNMSAIGGTIRVGELAPDAGPIRHALKLSIHDLNYNWTPENQGQRWPASNSDVGEGPGRYRGTNPALRMGSLVCLPQWFAVPALETTPGQRIAKCLQTYGAYIVDSQTWDVACPSLEYGPAGDARLEFERDWRFPFDQTGGPTPWLRDWRAMLASLHVVNSNSETNIGGGPTNEVGMRYRFDNPLDPLLPPPPLEVEGYTEAQLRQCAEDMLPFWRFITGDPDHLKVKAMEWILNGR